MEPDPEPGRRPACAPGSPAAVSPAPPPGRPGKAKAPAGRPPGARNVFVANLGAAASDESLRDLFAAAGGGEVLSAKVMLDIHTGRSRGFGFVLFRDAAAGGRALVALQGATCWGRRLTLAPAETSGRAALPATGRVIVRNVPRSVSPASLRRHFGKFGELRSATPRDDATQAAAPAAAREYLRTTAVLLLEFADADAAAACVQGAHNTRPWAGMRVPLLAKPAETAAMRCQRRARQAARAASPSPDLPDGQPASAAGPPRDAAEAGAQGPSPLRCDSCSVSVWVGADAAAGGPARRSFPFAPAAAARAVAADPPSPLPAQPPTAAQPALHPMQTAAPPVALRPQEPLFRPPGLFRQPLAVAGACHAGHPHPHAAPHPLPGSPVFPGPPAPGAGGLPGAPAVGLPAVGFPSAPCPRPLLEPPSGPMATLFRDADPAALAAAPLGAALRPFAGAARSGPPLALPATLPAAAAPPEGPALIPAALPQHAPLSAAPPGLPLGHAHGSGTPGLPPPLPPGATDPLAAALMSTLVADIIRRPAAAVAPPGVDWRALKPVTGPAGFLGGGPPAGR